MPGLEPDRRRVTFNLNFQLKLQPAAGSRSETRPIGRKKAQKSEGAGGLQGAYRRADDSQRQIRLFNRRNTEDGRRDGRGVFDHAGIFLRLLRLFAANFS